MKPIPMSDTPMSDTPDYREASISQLPALKLLMALGYDYLSPEEALRLRGGRPAQPVLTEVLAGQLRALNRFTYKGQTHPFSDAAIAEAIRRLTDEPYDGLIPTSERLYDLLTLGTAINQTVQGDTRGYSLSYIDWQRPERNVYHVTDEFEVERARSHATRRPDVVCFVNGIPLAVIECKRPDKTHAGGESAVYEAVSQHLRNQRDDEVPHLYVTAQLLLAISVNDALFATTNTPRKYWSLWREEDAERVEPLIHGAINKPLTQAQRAALTGVRPHPRQRDYLTPRYSHVDGPGERLPTAQDRLIHALLRPERLLELAYQFIVYDGGVKKIARHQQYFAVRRTLARVTTLDAHGVRAGGVIWHTTGSGKSLTMVMLAKALALHPAVPNPKVILVTDRIDLDDQIWKTFAACGKKPVQATSGRHLIELVRSPRAEVITTVIDKFETAAAAKVKDDSADIFVLVDESHRSQYGATHTLMRRVFPRACFIGFTGTPLLKKEKSTAGKFGAFIHTYPIRAAVEDGAVVPLLYEGRLVELRPDQAAIDLWFERVTRGLSEEQKLDLKRKFSRRDEVNQAEARIRQIAYDVSEHFRANHQGTGRKAQLAVPGKAIALKYRQCLDEFGLVSSAVVISSPDTREGHESTDEADVPEVQRFWKEMMALYGDEKRYVREIKASFAREDGVEILIVVDKLLTGFDEPRNTVLYIDKSLKEHNLLQAISRVNRLYEGKPYGYIIDYRGVLGELNATLNVYDALAGFDVEDVAGAVTDVGEVIRSLPPLHSAVWAVFAPVANKGDTEQLERFLEPENVREQFYEALRAFARALGVTLGTVEFYETVAGEQIDRYKRDLVFFTNLRQSVRLRYAERIEYGDYDKAIRKLMDRHIDATEVTQITAPVNIFDVEAFDAEVEKVEGAVARADTIAYRMKRTITERMEQDPAFYRKFSELIDETISAYKQGRLDEAQYYEQIAAAYHDFTAGREATLPARLRNYRHAPAYYGIVREHLTAPAGHAADGLDSDDLAATAAIRLEEIIEARKVRDWVGNSDVQNHMRNDIEDYLFRLKGRYELALDYAEIDAILEQVIHTARQRNNL